MALEAKTTAGHNRDTLIELVGTSGKNGKISTIEEDVDQNTKDIGELKKFNMSQLKWSGAGALGGGGLIAGIIEAVRHFA